MNHFNSSQPPEHGTSCHITLVSVIIPCFRQAQFLADAIESVLSQTYATHEIVVIDDGSPDNTSEVASRYQGIRCIRQQNSGLASARNRGLRETTGEYLIFLDADDRLLPNALSVGVDALDANPECAFTWGFNRPIGSRGNVLGGISNPLEKYPSYADLLERNIVGPPVGAMFRRGPLIEAGGFACFPPACEDYELYLRLARNRCFHCHHELVAEYRYHDSKMSSDCMLMLKAMLLILERETEWLGHNRDMQHALERGRRHVISTYAVAPQVEELVDHLHAGRWLSASGIVSHLLFTYPGMFMNMVFRRLRRRLYERTLLPK